MFALRRKCSQNWLGLSRLPLSSIRNMTTTISTTNVIEQKINDEFSPSIFKIRNDSAKHVHHAIRRGSDNSTESHFRLLIVSKNFEGKSQPVRHRMVYSLLQDEINAPNGIFGLQLETKTPEEYEKVHGA